ncbi:ADP-ribosylglycohydrolase family protein [Thermoleptolyngbya sichuanensis XZ-Cy5]|uniref:ADP-ribosylglycohydrolase family protein n=1 Tax=Thermoleptolyngbya sichuanensis TaxID=2885951 RepID=UPI00240D3C56|nr:ADP-ribosylglycohydrolase family protein [Thermoleptolyngbya sichuanensis]MDG2616255.1 ADP-ribosylglycohydrolase family protein [Thermoleptolyngbya sichuanensis XZ-Cy5]
MGDRLLNQYRGALLGAALGQVLGANAQAQGQPDWRQVERWGFDPPAPHDSPPDLAAGLGKSMLSLGEGLIHRPQQSVALPSAILGNPAALAIATLPLALYTHDHPEQLRSHLQRLDAPASSQSVALAVGELVSQAMHADQPPQVLIERAIAAQDLMPIAPDLTTALQRVHIAAQQDSSAIARHTLFAETPAAYLPLCLALYCFLSTPNDAAIALRRAAQISPSPLTCALVGAFCGARNGSSGLPATWRGQAHRAGSVAALWGIPESAIDSLAAMLFAAWAGIYLPTLQGGKLPNRGWVVAPAGKLRPR